MTTDPAASPGSAALALLLLVAVAVAVIGLRMAIRSLRARKTQGAVGMSFSAYALQALVNAARLDGKVDQVERAAILVAMRQIEGAAYENATVEAAFAAPPLSKNELVAYLRQHAQSFTRDQKAALLKGLLSVFVSDGRFDEVEHAALVDYTEAVGFDRDSAVKTLRNTAQQFIRGSIT